MRTALLLALLPVVALAQPRPVNERLDVAMKAYSLASSAFRSGSGHVETAGIWSKRVYELQKEARAASAGTDYLYRMRDLEKVATTRVEAGTASRLELLEATFLRLEAETAVKK